MYQDYIEGKRELWEINMGFRTSYVKDDEAPIRTLTQQVVW